MARLLVGGDWFDPVESATLYETTFEAIVMQHADKLYPGFYAFPFKTLVHSDEGSARPDMALVDQRMREWWIVEVEMQHHSLAGHVLPQVRKLSRADYAQIPVHALSRHMPLITESDLRRFVQSTPPRILVISNAYVADWDQQLQPYGAILGVFEIFRSEFGQIVFRVNGEHPRVVGDQVTNCYFDKTLSTFLVLESPGGMNLVNGQRVALLFGGALLQWTVVSVSDTCWLKPVGRYDLNSQSKYAIFELANGYLELRDISR